MASTFVSVMRKAPDMTRAMTSTEPTTRPANDARKMGSFLLLVLTTVRVSVCTPGVAGPPEEAASACCDAPNAVVFMLGPELALAGMCCVWPACV